jgi:hypothetical protein
MLRHGLVSAAIALLVAAVASAGAASQPAAAAARPNVTIKLEEWYAERGEGKVTLTERGRDVIVRIELERPLRAFPMAVKIYGGHTPGIAWPRTDCDVVYNNAMTYWDGTGTPDKDVSIRRALGTIRAVPAQKIIRRTTVTKLRRSADAIAVWSFGVVFACGDF